MTIISDCVPSDKISQNPDNAELGYRLIDVFQYVADPPS